jgi:hypothetical protein
MVMAEKKITLGADPEFEIRDAKTGRMKSAHDFGLQCGPEYKVGCDGCSTTGEFRLDPGNWRECSENLGKLIGQLRAIVGTDYFAYAGSGKDQPLGGHIHFGSVKITIELLRKLDQFIANPLNKISNYEHRRDHGYGKPIGTNSLDGAKRNDSWREQPHGWEYRTPLSWISHPVIARGVLAISGVLARASEEKMLDSLKTTKELEAYAFKPEQKAMSDYFAMVSDMVCNDEKLETIEMFAAWKKLHITKKPSFDVFWRMEDWNMREVLSQFNEAMRIYPNKKCSVQNVRIHGYDCPLGNEKAIVYLSGNIMEKMRGCKPVMNDVQFIRDDGLVTTIRLSKKLRSNPEKAAKMVKHIICRINKPWDEKPILDFPAQMFANGSRVVLKTAVTVMVGIVTGNASGQSEKVNVKWDDGKSGSYYDGRMYQLAEIRLATEAEDLPILGTSFRVGSRVKKVAGCAFEDDVPMETIGYIDHIMSAEEKAAAKITTDGWVFVNWDNGETNTYRILPIACKGVSAVDLVLA